MSFGCVWEDFKAWWNPRPAGRNATCDYFTRYTLVCPCLSCVTHTILTYMACLHVSTSPPLPHSHTTHTKGYYGMILIYMWNVLSYASSSVLSAIWLLPCDWESHALLIESDLVWSTHTHLKTYIHPLTHTHTHTFSHWQLCCKWRREKDGCQAEHDEWTSIIACQSCLFSFHTNPLSISSYFSSASLINLCLERWCEWRMQSNYMDKTLAVHRC